MERLFDRPRDIIVVGCAAIILLLPSLDSILKVDPVAKQPENRSWTHAPAMPKTIGELKTWGDDLTHYFSDHFGFRNALVRLNNYTKVKILKVSASPLITITAEGWMLLTGQGAFNFYRNLKPFSPEELKAWVSTIQDQQTWLKERGIKFQVVICPDPTTVYPEILPDWAKRKSGPTRRETLIRELNQFLDIPVIDLAPVLQHHGRLEPLYHATDTHWNRRGGFIGAEAAIRQLLPYFPQIHPFEPKLFVTKPEKKAGGDLSLMQGLSDLYQENDIEIEALHRFEKLEIQDRDFTTINPSGEPLDVVIVRDSYGTNMEAAYSGYFRKVRYVWDNVMPIGVIEKYKPQLVIWQMVERKLSGVPRPNPPEITLRGKVAVRTDGF